MPPREEERGWPEMDGRRDLSGEYWVEDDDEFTIGLLGRQWQMVMSGRESVKLPLSLPARGVVLVRT
jgi:hypothetical protein